MPKHILFAVAITAASLVMTGVSAQTPRPPATVAPADPSAKSPGIEPKDVPLSEKLDKNEGVLKPPKGVDPEMNKGAPKTTGDKMPVIVPPGEPGGDQSIQPK